METKFRGLTLKLTTKEALFTDIKSGKETIRIATVGPEFIERAQYDRRFHDALQRMTHHTIDGSGLLFALQICARIRGEHDAPIQKYTGADLAEDLFAYAAKTHATIGLLGGRPGSAQALAQTLKKRFNDISIVFAEDGGVVSENLSEFPQHHEEIIKKYKPDILLLAFGAPKQEILMDLGFDLPVSIMIGVGGTFDFYSVKKRAPKIMQQLHLEWLYRAVTEKGHGKRVLVAAIVFPLRTISWIIQGGARKSVRIDQ